MDLPEDTGLVKIEMKLEVWSLRVGRMFSHILAGVAQSV